MIYHFCFHFLVFSFFISSSRLGLCALPCLVLSQTFFSMSQTLEEAPTADGDGRSLGDLGHGDLTGEGEDFRNISGSKNASNLTLVVENEELRARIAAMEEEMDVERDRILETVQKKLLEKDEVLSKANAAIKNLQTQLRAQIQRASKAEEKAEEAVKLAAALEGRSRDREALASECAALRERTRRQAKTIVRLQHYIRKLEGCESCGEYPIFPGIDELV